MLTCTKFAKRTDSTVSMCTLDNVVKELHPFSACERLSLLSYICVYSVTKTILE